jgi:hypothetical protein
MQEGSSERNEDRAEPPRMTSPGLQEALPGVGHHPEDPLFKGNMSQGLCDEDIGPLRKRDAEGIPPQEDNTVLQPFSRARSAARSMRSVF